MIFGYFTLLVALTLSIIAAFYSVTGLIAIFAALPIPIMIMGGSLEVAKIVATVWLHKYWHRSSLRYKLYLVPAVAGLMVLTSMGIYGLLSKAHLDQAVPSGDVAAKVALYDEKIKNQKDNIQAARANLSQLDAAVNETMGRSTSEQGASRAVEIRRGQARDRARLTKEIESAQNEITTLQEQRAPIAAEQRKVEAEVGPIKYIAALIYGQNATEDTDLLEKAVRWVIILIVSVFDPLALILILAATQTIEWEQSDKSAETMDQVNNPKDEEPKVLADADENVASLPLGDWTESDFDQLANDLETEIATEEEFFKRGREIAQRLDAEDEQRRAQEANELVAELPVEESYEVTEEDTLEASQHVIDELTIINDEITAENLRLRKQIDELVDQIHTSVTDPVLVTRLAVPESNLVVGPGLVPTEEPKLDIDALKKLINEHSVSINTNVEERPGDYVQPTRILEAAPGRGRGVMSSAPVQADNVEPVVVSTHNDFGNTFPQHPSKGDTYLRTDYLPNRLFKFNGNKWLELDKDQVDVYAYDELYIKHLIDQISTGNMDVENLSDLERDQIRKYLTR